VIPGTQLGDVKPSRTRVASGLRKKAARIDWEAIGPKLLLLTCVLITAGMLVAGLWPFQSPRNQVEWFAGGKGLQLGRHGTVISSGKFKAANMPADAPCSLEVWIEPARPESSGTIFAFYSPEDVRQFSLCQSVTDLALRSDSRRGRFRILTTRLYVDDIFRRGKPLFVTVTSKGGQTAVYIDGSLARAGAGFPLSSRDFDGELVIGTSPRLGDTWSGLVLGLAFYDQDLSPAQVLRHYERWREKGKPDASEDELPVALYQFDERAGRVIHNQVSSGPDLYIPDRYLVLDQVLLQPFWQEFHTSLSYWKDVLINIAGFVPFGFLLCAYFSLAGRVKRPALVTILLGFTLSFTIEFFQSFLPTRDSGTTDLFTNTLGTGLGVWLYHLNFWRIPCARLWALLRLEEQL